ncbi:MAG TPA: CHASE domain-containing protein [Pyrinomonadaceae bacterium]|nr:CHASE domain-containing protein [Pyrinomonadaceae bacterium]
MPKSKTPQERTASPSRGSRVFLPYLILLLGFCFTLLTYYYFSKLTYEQDKIRFDGAVQEIHDQVRLRIATSITLLRAATGLFAASDSVNTGEFDRFVQQVELEKNYPGIQGIGYSQWFRAEDKASIISRMQREGVPDFHVFPDDSPRREYTAILYLQPVDDVRNKRALGFDMFSEAVRRQAMETARDTGNPTASGRVQLIQEQGVQDKQEGFLIYAPVYRNTGSLSNESQRRKALMGFVYSPYRADDFLEPVAAEKHYDVAFQIYDGTELTRANLLTVKHNDAAPEPRFTAFKTQDVAGRTWTIAYATKPSFEKGSSRYVLKYTVILGVLLSLLFAAVTRAEIRARSRAERATADVRESEATIRKTFGEREQAEEALQQTTQALREADQRALLEYERLLERIKGLAQVLGAARELKAIFLGLREFTEVSVPCNGFFVSLYDPARDIRTACYGWADGQELDVSELPAMRVTETGPNSRAIRTGEVIITNDYMRATSASPGVIVGPDNGLRPDSSLAVPMAVMGRIIGTIEVQSYEANVYRPEHVTAMSMAANLTAVAVENVRLLKLERTAREAAEESNRLKDEFLATVSHELRTPLTAILGWSRLLEGGTLDDAVTQQAVETIGRNAKAQAQIVDDILDVSRIITGNLYIDLRPLEVIPVVENAINVVRPTADAKGIKIETYFDAAPATISGDANRLQQVVWNLLSNAVKFTDSGGRVCVKVWQVGATVEIRVSDTGQGISKEFLPFVFDRFRQADSTTTRQHGGLGLGLAIARHLVEIHGGTIKAESQGAGMGATFTIRLPLVEAALGAPNFSDASHRKTTRATQLLSGLNVLLVDDDSDTLTLMATALTKREANVTAVSSANDAIKAITQKRPDVLVSDIAMPDEDGYGLIEKIRSLENGQSETIPAVAITAYAKEEDRRRALSSGFQIYLAKPVELTELISVVARAARRDF